MTDARHPLVELTLARLRMFVREPGAVFWTFGFPILMSLALGIAFRSRPPDPVKVAVVAGAAAEPVRAALDAGGLRVTVADDATAKQLLRSGKVAVVVVPTMPRAYLFDETRPESRVARLVVDDRLQRADGRTDPTATRDELVTEPGARYIDFLLPGLLGLSLLSSGLWGIGWVIVEMRTRKLIKRMTATPMKRGHFLLSFVSMRMVILLFEIPLLFGFGWLFFDVRVRGSLLLLCGLVLLGAMTFAGVGLLVASRAQNTQTAGGLVNLVMMPMMIGSGVFFSSERFPSVMQPIVRILPLTMLNDALRAVVNEGAGLSAVAPAVLDLSVCGVVSFALALKLFRWT